MSKKKVSYASLAWQFKDYQENNCEVPDRIKKYPHKTEGEMMSEEEIEFWFADSLKVLQVLKEEDTKIFEKLHQDFILDLEYLLSLGKIEEDVLDYINDTKNLDFDKELDE